MMPTKLARRYCGNLVSVTSRSLNLNIVATLSSYPLSFVPLCRYSLAAVAVQDADRREVFMAFKDWFRTGKIGLLDLVFKVLNEGEESGLSKLQLRLTEQLVLQVLSYGNARYDTLSCLKFFDWAGRQPGFFHTRATMHAVFKILYRAKLKPLMGEYLDSYVKNRFMRTNMGFYTTLVMGYALAGQIPVALQLLGKMRFHGLDLDCYVYNILLNVLVDEGFLEAADAISKHMFLGKLQDEATYSILVKRFCKQKMFDEAETYLHDINSVNMNGWALTILVDALCQSNEFERAKKLLEEFEILGVVPMNRTYTVWIKNLVRIGKVNESLQFMDTKKLQEGFIPDAVLFNILLLSLLKLNRTKDVCYLLSEMQGNGVTPNQFTMSIALCFLCKVGMADIAVDLYESTSEFGMSPNAMAYAYIASTLCGEGNIEEACLMIENSAKQGYFPGRKIFLKLAFALCREKKLDKLMEVLLVTCRQKCFIPDSVYAKFISELCRARRVEDAYLLFSELNRMERVAGQTTYTKLIRGLNISNRGEISARLLVEMQAKGYKPSRSLFRSVISLLLKMDEPETQFLTLLELQLSHLRQDVRIYNFFIEGAGQGKRPELARQVYEIMQNSGVEPNQSSAILLLQAYLRNRRVSDAMDFFNALYGRRKIGRKLWNAMIVGLSKVDRSDLALDLMHLMKQMDVVPSGICYEALIERFCQNRSFEEVVKLVYDLANFGRRLTSFSGNILLSSCIRSDQLYLSWSRFLVWHTEVPRLVSALHPVIRLFSSHERVTQQIETVEAMIGQCFPTNLYTYNMLLKRLCITNDMETVCNLYHRLSQNGCEPNKWTITIIVHAFLKQGKTNEALRWLRELETRGFDSILIDAVRHDNVFRAS